MTVEIWSKETVRVQQGGQENSQRGVTKRTDITQPTNGEVFYTGSGLGILDTCTGGTNLFLSNVSKKGYDVCMYLDTSNWRRDPDRNNQRPNFITDMKIRCVTNV